jgi:hypothetical protein
VLDAVCVCVCVCMCVCGVVSQAHILKKKRSFYTVTFSCKCTRVLTFENF